MSRIPARRLKINFSACRQRRHMRYIITIFSYYITILKKRIVIHIYFTYQRYNLVFIYAAADEFTQ